MGHPFVSQMMLYCKQITPTSKRLKATKMHFSLIRSPHRYRRQLAHEPQAGSARSLHVSLGTERRKREHLHSNASTWWSQHRVWPRPSSGWLAAVITRGCRKRSRSSMSGANVRLPTLGWAEMPARPQWGAAFQQGWAWGGATCHGPLCLQSPGQRCGWAPGFSPTSQSEASKVEATYSERVNARVRHRTGRLTCEKRGYTERKGDFMRSSFHHKGVVGRGKDLPDAFLPYDISPASTSLRF